ncbi:MAG: hypothetical protein JRG80_16400 [Deltaproteobacteria bacterium]|nr:hypothetical protein [Deltaproteobacteria bacterium]MBW2667290.1 hypothetical protein [Deltaproteobacteria bacterium]
MALSVGFFALRCATSSEIPYLSQRGPTRWIMSPLPVSAELQQWGRASAPVTSFRRGLPVPTVPESAVLALRAYRGFVVVLNGEALPDGRDDGATWRRKSTLELAPLLQPGWNEIRIDVANAHGPALIALRITGLAEPVASDGSWEVWRDGRRLGAAMIADDTRRNPAARAVETPFEALTGLRNVLLGLFVAAVVTFLGVRRFAGGTAPVALPFAAFAAACVAWLAALAGKFVRIPLEVGFDARHHGLYVDFLRTNGSVPLATDGWSVYHPPLFYAVAAVMQWLGESVAGAAGGAVGMKALPFLAGLANVWVALALCRRLFPGEASKHLLATVFAAVLPMNLYSAAYFSNETFHALLAGLALLVAVDLLLESAATARRVFFLGVLLGLALLTKFTAVLVTAVIAFFLGFKLIAVERIGPLRLAQLLAWFALPPLLLAGWFYLRNALLFGDPLIANWGHLPGETQKWWQQPGFHTAAFYLNFGDSFSQPYLSAFHSYWDSLYSTLWGDGGIAGRVNPTQRHGFWNYDFMSTAYLIAIPASGFALAGALRCVMRALSDDDPGRRAAFSLVTTLTYAVLFGLTYMSLRLPYFAQAKASYGLVVMPVLSLFFADGFAWLDEALARRGLYLPRAVAFGWFAVFVVVCFLAFAA